MTTLKYIDSPSIRAAIVPIRALYGRLPCDVLFGQRLDRVGRTRHGVDARDVAGLWIKLGFPSTSVWAPRGCGCEDGVEGGQHGHVTAWMRHGLRPLPSTRRHTALVVHVPSKDLKQWRHPADSLARVIVTDVRR